MKRQIPLIICFLFGLFMLIQFFIPHPTFVGMYKTILNWAIVIGVFAVVIGISTLIRIHFMRIMRLSSGWPYSIVVLVGLVITAAAGIIGGPKGVLVRWIAENILVPLDATIFSLLAFFMASAAYKAFRARTMEAALLLAAALIVMFGRVPIGDFIWQNVIPRALVDKAPFLPENLVEWIMSVPNTAARRGIMIGAALGAISTSLKIILGIERAYFGGSQ